MMVVKLFILCVVLIPTSALSQLYVSATGSDRNEGNKSAPYATIAMAVRKAREMRRLNDPSIKHGIEIIVENGTYRFSEPLFIRPEDSGTDGSLTIIKAAANARPVFSGGIEISGWKKLQVNVNGIPTNSKK